MKDCIDKILEFYKNKDLNKSVKGQIWIGRFLINLMTSYNQKCKEDPLECLFIRNCLLLLINLLFNVKTPDHYHVKGKEIQELTINEREIIMNLLKDEINLSQCN